MKLDLQLDLQVRNSFSNVEMTSKTCDMLPRPVNKYDVYNSKRDKNIDLHNKVEDENFLKCIHNSSLIQKHTSPDPIYRT